MANTRDDFTQKTKDILMKRVGGKCSNPDCPVKTEGPNDNPNKATTIGVAAHISAASTNGPRYDKSLTSDERRDISNGIWLCSNCAGLIDRDEANYPVELLVKWKEDAERHAANEQSAANERGKAASANSQSANKFKQLPEQTAKLIGRQDILTELQNTITQPNSSSHLLVNGMGGIGKTAICKTLAHSVTEQLNAVIWLDCQGGLENALQGQLANKLEVNLASSNWVDNIINKLNDIQAPAALFIDNLEHLNDLDSKIIHKLKTLNWHIVATSRSALNHFDEKHDVDVLPYKQCIELFKHHYELDINDSDTESLNELITLAGRHTLTIELLAKIATNDMLELSELLSQIKATGFDLTSLTEIEANATHSGTAQQTEREHQLHEHLAKLFTLSSLDTAQQQILRLLAILPYQGYHGKKQLMPWLQIDKASSLVALAKKGWL